MKEKKLAVPFLLLCGVMLTTCAFSQPFYQEITLTDKTAFSGNTSDWKIAGEVWYNPFRNRLKEESGTGVLKNIPSGNRQTLLFTKMEHGNLLLDLDFMLAPHSSATLFLQGRYGIYLTDSWTDKNSITQACGAILGGNSKSNAKAERAALFIPPRSNLARAPGLWQHLQVVFQAPQFDGSGNKISNARLLRVSLNGVPVHEDIMLPDIVPSALFENESKTGPLVFSTDSHIAFKSVRYAFFENAEKEKMLTAVPVPILGSIPLMVTPLDKTVMQRCFLGEDHQKLTVCAVVGEPEQIHYGINLEQGAVIRLWKGDFIDATTMWESRGALQLARPMGSVISLPSQPLFAQLTNTQAAWPEFMQQGFAFKGYVLDKPGRPTFYYNFKGIQITDRTVPSENFRALTRTVQFENKAMENNLWIRLAAGTKIEKLEDGLYAINNKTYYIRLGSKKQRGYVLRGINEKQELLIPASAVSEMGLTWSYIW